jgi:hypothetical protein
MPFVTNEESKMDIRGCQEKIVKRGSSSIRSEVP